MDFSVSVYLALGLLVLAANLPFFTERLFLALVLHAGKGLAWRLLEGLIYCSLAIAAARMLERHLGQNYPQSWEFYAALACLCLTLAFPGFVWRHLRRQ